MESVSLIDLVVDYEVPPILINEAIVNRRLRPIVRRSASLSLADIAFRREDIEIIFWEYSLKLKSAQEKAELARRFARHDAIRTGIISAVVASGITAVASEAFDELTRPRVMEPRYPRIVESWPPPSADRIASMPPFRPPVEPPWEQYVFTFTNSAVTIALRNGGERDLVMIAAASGSRMGILPLGYKHSSLSIIHGKDWMTSYEAVEGDLLPLISEGDEVRMGQPIVRVRALSDATAVAAFVVLFDDGDHSFRSCDPNLGFVPIP